VATRKKVYHNILINKMKAKVCGILDINEPEKELYGLWITNGKGKKGLPGAVDGKPYVTVNKEEAENKAKEFNAKKN
jgi:hypothetical protein